MKGKKKKKNRLITRKKVYIFSILMSDISKFTFVLRVGENLERFFYHCKALLT
jgi:hypothetical protein